MNNWISKLENDNTAYTLCSALKIMDECIDASLGESASNVSKFFSYLYTVLESKRDPQVLKFASKVLGHLAKASGAMAADEVECQVKTALSWLHGDRVEHLRLAAVLILKEMAENAPTVFNIHVHEFEEAIWAAVRDQNLEIRERAVEALRACLQVIEKRETRWRIQWAALDGFVKNAPVHCIHGSLLAVGELLRNASEFMMPRYREVVNIVMDYLESSDRLVRLSITSLLPRIAHFSTGLFVTSHSKIIIKHFLKVLSIPAERASGFIALGEMAGVLDGALVTDLPTITSHLRDAIAHCKGKPPPEALTCVGSLARALGSEMECYVHDLLDDMFIAGLSSPLVETLEQITTSIPSLLPTIQDRLIHCISPIRSRSSDNKLKASMSSSRGNVLDYKLPLQILGHFNLKGQEHLEFARESVVKYLEDEDAVTRKEAALCCCQLIANSFAVTVSPQFSSNRCNRLSGKKRILIEEIVEKLLVAAVADADVFVRRSVFSSLHTNGLDDFLAQADSLSAIFASLNDEDFEVREYAILLAGRLSERNPAYVLPALRRHLMQLLTYLHKSPDNKCREESAQLLGCLIRSCERLILPYIAPIHKVLVAKLSEGAGVAANDGIITGVLVTVGDLARVGGSLMRKNIPELMPLIVDALLDGVALGRCEVAIVTLRQVVESTGYVVTPYNEYPQLLGLLLKLLNGELPWSTRREVLKVIGSMGALDPHLHKRNQQSLSGSHGDVARAGNDASQLVHSVDGFPSDLWPSFATTEDYFSTVAISFLVRILRDPSLSSYHQTVVGSLIFIFKSMGLNCVTYLPKVLPDLLHIVRTCDDALKEFVTWKLGTLVSIVQRHISKYLPDLLSLISELWSSFCLPAPNRPVRAVLHLVEHLCVALNDEFRIYLPSILPCCIQVLADAEQYKDYAYVPDILHTLEVLGGTLDEHMHLLVPALIRLLKVNSNVSVKQDKVNSDVSVKRDIIKTLTRLIPRVQISGHLSTLMHHLKLVLDGESDELRNDAVNAFCCLAYALGEDFSIFVPSIHKLLLKHCIRHKEFQEIEGRFEKHEPLISSSTGIEKLTRHLPADPISDPLDDLENDSYDDGSDAPRKLEGHQVNDGRLRTTGEASQCSTKEDWAEWMRHFSIEILRESPFPALRTCAKLAQLQPSVDRELFAAGFVSCLAQPNGKIREQLVWSVEMALFSPNIPSEILAMLLNLAELMEHEENPLPIDIRLLGALTDKCRAFAKSLRYKEMEFEGARCIKTDGNPVILVEALIHINNQLQQDEAAVGILTYAQQHLGAQLKESWYEKVERWADALRAYTAKTSHSTGANILMDATLGRMRCLDALGRWEELSIICKEYWASAEPAAQLEMAPMAASAAWNMGEWDQMAEYVSILDDGDETKLRTTGDSSNSHGSNGTFFRAILLVHNGQYDEAREYVEKARKCSATELAALVLESYDRAYSSMVRVQQLTELEEVISYCSLPVGNPVAEAKRALIRSMWTDRLQGAKGNVKVWQVLLGVRTLVLPPTEDVETWLKFASLCRKNGRIPQARSTLVKLLQYDPESSPEKVMYRGPPQVMYAYLKCQWSLGDEARRNEAFMRLKELCMELSSAHNLQSMSTANLKGFSSSGIPLLARVHLKLGSWKWALSPGLEDECAQGIRNSFGNATQCASKWAKAWHHWALFNTAVMSHYTLNGYGDVAHQFVVAAVTGYFNSIACGANVKGGHDSLQDILRLLTLWFNHGATEDVQMALQKGFSHVNINTWLVVLPQIIARIHSNNHAVRELIQSLLVRVGQTHPQAVMYPLLVACKSISNLRRAAAQEVVDKVRQHSGVLVDQAQLVSTELTRVAILWHEMWHEALEEASHLYFGEHNIEGMLKVLEPLHAMLEEGPRRSDITIKENAFMQAYHHELLEAYDCCMNYKRTGKDAELTQAWRRYYQVFRQIDKQLQSLTTLGLQSVSPALLDCCDLQLAVPGTYRADSPVVTIASFATQLEVIPSKQRPRKLTIYGSNGESYTFLLKGHEDLHQDERVMQLLGLVNTLLENSRKTAEKDLSIQRYSVIPLSPNSGLIGWVPNCDTLHHLIREYRDARNIILNQELKYILGFAPDYDRLPLIAKVEVFEYALQNTDGNDLSRIFWLKCRTSEVWLDRRTNYTRSLAVMSMVGYLLGLGDRHPSNLMLHRFSGKILHIDFGDCFEASMNREKFPEKVPFRLTRMLVKAMEVSGIEGNFRIMCENVMHVLRTHKDSVMAMMEAFVHDPLINWHLFNFNEVPQMATFMSANQALVNGEETCRNRELPHPQRGARERELLQAVNQLGDANEVLNERAVVVMARMSNKLTGRDFSSRISAPASPMHNGVEHNNLITGDARETDHSLSVKLQVQKLINQATSHENLCQNYVGWCPFW